MDSSSFNALVFAARLAAQTAFPDVLAPANGLGPVGVAPIPPMPIPAVPIFAVSATGTTAPIPPMPIPAAPISAVAAAGTTAPILAMFAMLIPPAPIPEAAAAGTTAPISKAATAVPAAPIPEAATAVPAAPIPEAATAVPVFTADASYVGAGMKLPERKLEVSPEIISIATKWLRQHILPTQSGLKLTSVMHHQMYEAETTLGQLIKQANTLAIRYMETSKEEKAVRLSKLFDESVKQTLLFGTNLHMRIMIAPTSTVLLLSEKDTTYNNRLHTCRRTFVANLQRAFLQTLINNLETHSKISSESEDLSDKYSTCAVCNLSCDIGTDDGKQAGSAVEELFALGKPCECLQKRALQESLNALHIITCGGRIQKATKENIDKIIREILHKLNHADDDANDEVAEEGQKRKKKAKTSEEP